MKNLALTAALFFLPLVASANEIEEVIVKSINVKIVMEKITEIHKQNPITGNWHYVTEDKRKDSA
jgi:hypothetical protein